jgi:thiol-disulfide isomerase/thioredoxin
VKGSLTPAAHVPEYPRQGRAFEPGVAPASTKHTGSYRPCYRQAAMVELPPTRALATVLVTVALLAGVGLRASAADAGAPARVGNGGSPAQQARIITEAELRTELASHKGRVTVLHFWATWCEPCLAELPFLARLAQDSKRKGVDFVVVSLDEPSEKGARQVSAVLAQRVRDPHWSVILKLADVGAFMNGIDPRWDGEIPVFFAYDHEGRLRRSHLGNIDQNQFGKLVAGLAPAEKR